MGRDVFPKSLQGVRIVSQDVTRHGEVGISFPCREQARPGASWHLLDTGFRWPLHPLEMPHRGAQQDMQ